MAKLLTAKSVEKLKPDPARRREIPDAVLPGFYLVIQPSGAKSWAVRYRHLGRPRKLTLGAYPAYDLADARSRAKEALQAVGEDRDPALEKRKRKVAAMAAATEERDAFPAVAREFITRDARPSNRSWKEAARLLGLRLDPEIADGLVNKSGGLVERWKDRDIGDIMKRDILDVLDGLADDGTPVLRNRTLSQLRRLFNWCIERDILKTSPCAGLKATEEASRDRVLSDAEIRLLWKAAEAQGYPFGPMVQLLLLTGQRRAEVAGMALTELSGDGRLWSLPKSRTKNGEAHDVPLSEAAAAIIRGLPRIAGAGYLFTRTGTTPVSGFSRSKRRLDRDIAAEAGDRIPAWTVHDLRRTCASGMASLGVAPHIIEAVLNHKSGKIAGVAKVYNRFEYASEKAAGLEVWARRVDEIVTGRVSTVVPFPAARGA